eukprot:scaffold1439_cov404-Prasinococcus_capsulatus_cf.AAC.36
MCWLRRLGGFYIGPCCVGPYAPLPPAPLLSAALSAVEPLWAPDSATPLARDDVHEDDRWADRYMYM